jgi:hypothetical protein
VSRSNRDEILDEGYASIQLVALFQGLNQTPCSIPVILRQSSALELGRNSTQKPEDLVSLAGEGETSSLSKSFGCIGLHRRDYVMDELLVCSFANAAEE